MDSPSSRSLCALALALSLGAPCLAQEESPPQPFPSPARSTWYSIGFTVVPVAIGALMGPQGQPYSGALGTAGVLLGPATGYWYGGIGARAWPGLAIRTGGLVLFAVGGANCSGYSSGLSACSGGATAALIGGAALVAGSVIYDIATIGGKVRGENEQRARATVVPLFTPSERRVGVEVVVAF